MDNKYRDRIDNHQLWVEGKSSGKRAYLEGQDLKDVDLSGANLTEATLRDVVRLPL